MAPFSLWHPEVLRISKIVLPTKAIWKNFWLKIQKKARSWLFGPYSDLESMKAWAAISMSWMEWAADI